MMMALRHTLMFRHPRCSPLELLLSLLFAVITIATSFLFDHATMFTSLFFFMARCSLLNRGGASASLCLQRVQRREFAARYAICFMRVAQARFIFRETQRCAARDAYMPLLRAALSVKHFHNISCCAEIAMMPVFCRAL